MFKIIQIEVTFSLADLNMALGLNLKLATSGLVGRFGPLSCAFTQFEMLVAVSAWYILEAA